MRDNRLRALSCLILLIVIAALTAGTPALAASVAARVTAGKAYVYQNASQESKTVGKLKKGAKITVYAIRGKWAKVGAGGKTGYMLKSQLLKQSAVSAASAGAKSGGSVKKTSAEIRSRLTQKGYSYSSLHKALRIFQMANGLSVTGKANDDTLAKLFSSSANARPKVDNTAWSKSDVTSHFHRRGLAYIIDLATGTRIRIRRVGGTKHLDVEPKTAEDTAKLKKIYGGTWSWDSRAVLLVAGGKSYAGAINGMPHGSQISHSNNFDGQFCLHLNGCTTHGSGEVNSNHQANVKKAYRYFSR